MAAQRTTCRSCGAPIIMVRHDTTNRYAPLEPDPAGRWTIVHDKYFEASPRLAPEHRYTNHFATCPGAADHRKDAA